MYLFSTLMSMINDLPAKRAPRQVAQPVTTYFEGGLFGVQLPSGGKLYGYSTPEAAMKAYNEIYGK